MTDTDTTRSTSWTPAQVRAWVQRHGGNVTALARRLRVPRPRLQHWMSDAPSRRALPAYIQVPMELMDEIKEHRGDDR